MKRKWVFSAVPVDRDDLARRWSVQPIVAQLLANRGLNAEHKAETFLAPQLRNLHPPERLPGAVEAASIIVAAVRARQRIVLYGDYDVDGTTGVAILWHVLKQAGADLSFYVPHRIEEGYGLNLEAVKRLIEDGAECIVSVDCGITAVEVAEYVRETKATLIITDHHAPQAALPCADAIVHPAVGSGYPNPDICGAGVAFKLAWEIARQLSGGEKVQPVFRDLLVQMMPLAALGTIADVVSLTGENRIIACHGLSGLASTRIPGVRALIESAGIDARKVDGYDVGFKLAPRINAAGRMGHARLAVELLTRADESRAREIALYLEEHNRARQATDRKIARQAFEVIDRDNLASDARRAIVLASEEWHAGVIGIVASRVVERYHRPTILIALGNGEGQGSGRSVRHFCLNDALENCRDHLVSYGGHAMAAGLRIEPDRIGAFTDAFVSVANQHLTGDDLIPRLRIDAEVSLKELSISTVETISTMGPFGTDNPRPRLASDWLELGDEPRTVGSNGQHLQASFRENGQSIRGIGFGLGERIDELKRKRRCRVAFEPMINDFRGHRAVEMRMADLQFED